MFGKGVNSSKARQNVNSYLGGDDHIVEYLKQLLLGSRLIASYTVIRSICD